MGCYTKLGSKGQITIPAEVRQLLGVGPGDQIAFEVRDDGQVSVRAVPRLSVSDLMGIVPALDRKMSDDFDAEIEEAMQDLIERELGATTVR